MANRRVTAQDWEMTFSENPSAPMPSSALAEIRAGAAVLIVQIGQCIEKLEQLKWLPRWKRLSQSVEVALETKKTCDHATMFLDSIRKELSKKSDKLEQSEMVHSFVLLSRAMQLALRGTLQKEASKNAYQELESIVPGKASNLPSMFRVGSLSIDVRNRLRGTPLAYNLDFMRRLDPKASDQRNFEKIAAKLQRIDRKTIGPKEPPSPKESSVRRKNDQPGYVTCSFCKKRASGGVQQDDAVICYPCVTKFATECVG